MRRAIAVGDAMGREIAEGPAGVEATLAIVRASNARGLVANAGRVVLVGTGASLAVAEIAAPYFGERAAVREASAVALGDLDGGRTGRGDVTVVVSNSGRSPETRAAARRLADGGSPVVAVTTDPGSPLADAADVVVHTPIEEETGAATKSALSALAALLALGGALGTDEETAGRLRVALDSTVGDPAAADEAAVVLARSGQAWALGFGPALGLARATSLLLHEKARRPTIFCTPSEFRHGPIEAATPADVVVLLDPGDPDAAGREGARVAYLDRLAAETAELGVPLVRIGTAVPTSPAFDIAIPSAPAPAGRVLHALVRAQQLARATAHARGTYSDDFLVLRRVVRAAEDLLD
ncbi:MAG TPA: SIS domain-containing protein [Candidatus Limnocylindrales bacterium]|nr:SIS domain-containing protein [Candidatus Limnocylindrales bacterium]